MNGWGPQWRKSRRCDVQACLEVALQDGRVAVRNNTMPETHLTFAPGDWRDLIARVRDHSVR